MQKTMLLRANVSTINSISVFTLITTFVLLGLVLFLELGASDLFRSSVRKRMSVSSFTLRVKFGVDLHVLVGKGSCDLTVTPQTELHLV